MVTRWLSSAAAALGEVLAPTPNSRLEEFSNAWREMKMFYHDLRTSDEASLSQSAAKLPLLLHGMIRVLLEEDSEVTLNSSGKCSALRDIPAGPCLEFLLRNRIVETLCEVGIRDLPKGMRKQVLLALGTLLRNSRASLLPHMSVHRPLCNLLLACTQQSAIGEEEKSEYITLIATVIMKIREDPSLFGFFLTDNSEPPPANGAEAADGEGSAIGEGHQPLLAGLEGHLHEADMDGERARAALVQLLQLADHDGGAYLLALSGVCSALIANICERFRRQCGSDSGPRGQGGPAWAELSALLSVATAVARTAGPRVAGQVVEQWEHQFLVSTVGPLLLQVEERAAAAAMAAARDLLADPAVAGPLRDCVVVFLVGDATTAPERAGEADDHVLRTTLLRRMVAPAEPLALAALKLFDALIASHHPTAIRNLVLRNISWVDALVPTAGSSASPLLEYVQLSVGRFLSIFPGSPTAGYDAYLVEAHRAVIACKEHYERWPPLAASSPVSQADQPVHYVGLFLHNLFSLLARALHLPLDMNLLVTGIWTKLSHIPHHALHHYLLNTSPSWPANVPTLYKTLLQLAEELNTLAKSLPGFSEQLLITRQIMESGGELDEVQRGTAAADSQARALQAAVVLQEFAKELAATAQAKELCQLWST